MITFSRNGEFVGSVTSSAYGFTLHKMVALGFVHIPKTEDGKQGIVESQWVGDKAATWTIDIAGTQFPVTPHLHPPPMPIVTQESAHAEVKPKKKYPTVELLRKKRKTGTN